jgi:N-acyl homoserine lactone hydrolase
VTVSSGVTTSVETLLEGHSLTSAQGNPSFCGVYLVEAGTRRILFDCGHPGRRRALLAAFEARGLTPADVDLVVLSHGHWDHLQNVDLFGAAKVLLHEDELRYLADPPAHDRATPRWARDVLSASDVRETGDGDEIADGVRVVHLPGHTPGSIGLAVTTDTGTAVLTGDAVASARVLREGPSGLQWDTALATASVARVRQLADVVHPGHGVPFRTDAPPLRPVPLTFRVPGTPLL